MRSKRGGIKSWMVFVIVLIAFFGLLFAWQKQKESSLSSGGSSLEKSGPSGKSFATTPGLSSEEQAAEENQTLHQAWTTGQQDLCHSIADEAKQRLCLDQLAFNEALKNKDETQCELLVDPVSRDSCKNQVFAALATRELDTAFCEKISESSLKQYCFDRLQSLLSGNSRSLDSCEKITDKTLKNQCEDQVHFAASTQNTDSGGCEKIVKASLRERCSATVAQNQKVLALAQTQAQRVRKPVSAVALIKTCETLGEGADPCQNQANFNLALEKKDLSYCQKITDPIQQNECLEVQGGNLNRFYLKQAIALHDASACQKILNADLKTACMAYAQ